MTFGLHFLLKCPKCHKIICPKSCMCTLTINFTKYCIVDGGWSEWTLWSLCDLNQCGYQEEKRHRSCNNPYPKAAGEKCIGEEKETTVCRKEDPEPCKGGTILVYCRLCSLLHNFWCLIIKFMKAKSIKEFIRMVLFQLMTGGLNNNNNLIDLSQVCHQVRSSPSVQTS